MKNKGIFLIVFTLLVHQSIQFKLLPFSLKAGGHGDNGGGSHGGGSHGGGGHEDGGHAHTSKYNCTSNCLECDTHAPHKCHKCLFQWFVDEKSHGCKQCKVDRCNLCAEEKKCKTCRVGHTPEGEKCVPAKWFVGVAYILFLSSCVFGLGFFVVFAYCCCFVKDVEEEHGHGHGHDSHGDHHSHGNDSGHGHADEEGHSHSGHKTKNDLGEHLGEHTEVH